MGLLNLAQLGVGKAMPWRDQVKYGPGKRLADGATGAPADHFVPFEHGPSRAKIKKGLRAINAELARRAQGG